MKSKPADRLKTLEIRSRDQWRQWLERHHASSPGVWLVFYKRHTGRTSVDYESAVEEALCFGWVDSLVKRLDEARYAIKVTPRKPDSVWSDLNRRRYAKVKAEGLLAPAGVNRPPTARRYPSTGPRSVSGMITKALGAAPAIERELKANKREDTLRRRLQEAIGLLAAGRTLGLK